ncbi:hypothetical protein PG997_011704 [Apiospora hydei]|uniref:Uncharacterized protein n=1 Tax=Apiospora hydei TaxID=1337664 RepID=A0ABR1VJS6_9PEZI
MYMNWTGNPAMESSEHTNGLDEYASGTFTGQNTTSPAPQQQYPGQSYYNQAAAVDAGASHGQGHQFDYRTAPDSHQMWMPAMQTQQQQQQRPTASPGPGNFPSNASWQAASNTPPQAGFAQPAIQQYNVPASHAGYPQAPSRTHSATPYRS